MAPNPIDEIKQIRHQLGADAGFDIHRVFAELRQLQATSGRSYVDHPARRLSEYKAMHPSGESTRSEVENLSSPPGEH